MVVSFVKDAVFQRALKSLRRFYSHVAVPSLDRYYRYLKVAVGLNVWHLSFFPAPDVVVFVTGLLLWWHVVIGCGGGHV